MFIINTFKYFTGFQELPSSDSDTLTKALLFFKGYLRDPFYFITNSITLNVGELRVFDEHFDTILLCFTSSAAPNTVSSTSATPQLLQFLSINSPAFRSPFNDFLSIHLAPPPPSISFVHPHPSSFPPFFLLDASSEFAKRFDTKPFQKHSSNTEDELHRHGDISCSSSGSLYSKSCSITHSGFPLP